MKVFCNTSLHTSLRYFIFNCVGWQAALKACGQNQFRFFDLLPSTGRELSPKSHLLKVDADKPLNPNNHHLYLWASWLLKIAKFLSLRSIWVLLAASRLWWFHPSIYFWSQSMVNLRPQNQLHGLNFPFPTLHCGHFQSLGKSAKLVPGGIPFVGSPTLGS